MDQQITIPEDHIAHLKQVLRDALTVKRMQLEGIRADRARGWKNEFGNRLPYIDNGFIIWRAICALEGTLQSLNTTKEEQ